MLSALAHIPWFRVTIGCNTFIFLLEMYLDYRQASKMKRLGYGHVCFILSKQSQHNDNYNDDADDDDN